MKSLLPVFVFSLLTGFAPAAEFGTLIVTQLANNNNNTVTPPPGISIAYAPGKSIVGTFRTTANRGDYEMDFGFANDLTTGMLMTSIAQLGRDDSAVGGPGVGTFYATSAVEVSGTYYYIPIFQAIAGGSIEVNYNVSYAFLPYTEFVGGIATNSVNNGEMTSVTGSSGLVLGTHLTDLASPAGQYTLNLNGFTSGSLTLPANASQNGILLVNGAKNEDNYALSQANTNGTFSIFCKDNDANADSYENDPVAFSYLPVSAVGTNRLTALGRINGNGTADITGGAFSVTSGGNGQWYLTIPGQSQSTGTLIISAEGGVSNNRDNIVASTWDAANNRWIIESRDLPAANLQNITGTEDVFSFAFFTTPNAAPTASITAPGPNSFTVPASFVIEADAADINGTVSQVEFLRNGVVVGTDTEAPFTLTETALPVGSYSYIARATDDLGATGVSSAKVITVTFDPNNIPPNTALQFDGVNDHVTMGAAPELNVGGPPGNGLTLECWFRKTGTGLTASSGSGGVSAVPLFGKGRGENDGSNVDCNIFFGITSGGILVGDFESQATGLNHPITATNTPIVNGTWYHAAVTYDGVTSTWTMYLNGTPVGTASASVAGSVPRFDSIQHFGIGTAMNSSGVTEGAFAGVIDEARVWNRARSATEIAASMGEELSSGSGLLGRFGLNEGIGLSAGSSSGISVGTLTNGPVWVEGAPFTTINQAPVVSISEPLEGASSFLPYPVTLLADAADPDGTVAKVEFFVNGAKVGVAMNDPFNFVWTPTAAGNYAVSARAFDNLGAGKQSAAVNITIQTNPNQSPVISLTSPADASTIDGSEVSLNASLSDPEGDAMTVTFYGRETVPTTPGPDFTIVAIPDTQYYSEGSPGRANTVTVQQLVETFGEQTKWVVDNRNTRNIAFVSHMGDIVENGNFGGNPIQWERASAAMGKLEDPVTTLRANGIPYGLAPGNHDIDPIGSYDTGSTSFFNQYFNLSRFQGRSYWGGNYGTDNTNNYQLFSASGLDFIAIHLAYDTTPNQPILDWADALLKAYPSRRAIVTSHYIIGQGNPASFGTQGAAIYNNLKDNPNLFLLLCGHIHAEGRRSDTYQGRTVYSVLSDYQGLANGGQGLLRAFTFSPANNRIHVESWSPTQNRAASPTDNLPHFDGAYDLPYNMQGAASEWVPLGTVEVPAGGTTASINWTGLQPSKNYEWYAAVTDSVNTVSTSSRFFNTAAGTPPVVTLDSPVTGSTYLSPATVALSATATDDGSVVRVEFYNGGTKLGEDTTAPYEFSWSGVQPGTYTVSALAFDNLDLGAVSNSATITVNPGDLPPTIAITAPADGIQLEAPASFTITANASDAEFPVAKVEFFSGTANPVLLGEDVSEPFSLPLTNIGAGSYSYIARATDSLGQTADSAPVRVSVVVEAPIPTVADLSVGNFDLPSWIVDKTGPSPYQFNQPGTNAGDLELKINGSSVPFASGIAMASNWESTATVAAGLSSEDNISQPYADGNGNIFVSVLDNSNNNAAGANPSTSEQTSSVSAGFLPYASGWTGASVNSTGAVISGNLPSGVTVSLTGTGTYTVNGLSVGGNLLCFTNGDAGTLADNVCSVRIVNQLWVIDTRDNAGGTQNNDFSFVYLPPATAGVFTAKISATGVVSNGNTSAQSLGITAATGTDGVDITFGDGSVINPTTAALFLTADATNGGATSAAVDNLISWSANGNSFRVFTQDLEGVNGTNEPIDLRVLAIPFVPITPTVILPEVAITTTDAAAGEYGADQALEFTFTRTGSTAAALNVPLVASGSATAGEDYSGFSASVAIPIGQASVTLPLTVVPDALAEGTQTVTITLGSSVEFTAVSPTSANASISDSPAQDFYFTSIAAADRRAPRDDADGDTAANIIEYFMGTLPADVNSYRALEIPSIGLNTFKVRFPRAKNRPDVTGKLLWSADMRNWFASGASDGTYGVTFTENVISAPEADPEMVESTATITGPGTAPRIFVRLGVE